MWREWRVLPSFEINNFGCVVFKALILPSQRGATNNCKELFVLFKLENATILTLYSGCGYEDKLLNDFKVMELYTLY